jgi:hypothetical protein
MGVVKNIGAKKNAHVVNPSPQYLALIEAIQCANYRFTAACEKNLLKMNR